MTPIHVRDEGIEIVTTACDYMPLVLLGPGSLEIDIGFYPKDAVVEGTPTSQKWRYPLGDGMELVGLSSRCEDEAESHSLSIYVGDRCSVHWRDLPADIAEALHALMAGKVPDMP